MRAGVSPESVVLYPLPELNLAQVGWTSPVTNKLLFEARYSPTAVRRSATSCRRKATSTAR